MSVKGIILSAGFIMGALFVMSLQYTSASQMPDAPATSPSQMPDAPEVIELDHIGDMYERVIFNHAMHMDIATCATCHHHTPDAPPKNPDCLPCHNDSIHADTFDCKSCHAIDPESAAVNKEARAGNLFHIDMTGLKRAYHVQCMGCHREMDVSNECTDCHEKKGNMPKT